MQDYESDNKIFSVGVRILFDTFQDPRWKSKYVRSKEDFQSDRIMYYTAEKMRAALKREVQDYLADCPETVRTVGWGQKELEVWMTEEQTLHDVAKLCHSVLNRKRRENNQVHPCLEHWEIGDYDARRPYGFD